MIPWHFPSWVGACKSWWRCFVQAFIQDTYSANWTWPCAFSRVHYSSLSALNWCVCVLPPCIDGSFVPLWVRFILVVDKGKLGSFEKQFESPLNGKCFTCEKISVSNCHRQPQILILKGSFILLKGKQAKRTKADEENAVSCHFRLCSPREH